MSDAKWHNQETRLRSLLEPVLAEARRAGVSATLDPAFQKKTDHGEAWREEDRVGYRGMEPHRHFLELRLRKDDREAKVRWLGDEARTYVAIGHEVREEADLAPEATRGAVRRALREAGIDLGAPPS